jgi:hypothetical protein
MVRAMVNVGISILIINPNLNDFNIKMNSVFNTISEWFMVNSLSLNLNKIFYGTNVFRLHKMICKRRESCRHLFRKLKILPLVSQYILSFSLFVVNNRNQFKIHSEIHSINSRHFCNLYQPRFNLSKYQKGLNTHTQNCSNVVCV